MFSITSGGAGGIRTLDRALQPYNGLANRRLQPLGHSSISADMPDTSASRKRQIQITPRTFRAPERRAHSSRTADIRYRAFGRMFLVSVARRPLGSRHGRARYEPWSLRGVFAAPHALSKSREIDSNSPAARFDTAQITVPDRGAGAPAFATTL